ncbi:GTPase [Luteimonas sp. BDR2-5]|uniref:GTPase n=1 Tax=Proluteimonas luteida TaxID=2878685 RepID=UPI001E4265D0|nr:GTPase [Luteimonas sp. BDR2-5]MCD9026809.1 GTPase [Luteimonas sp. BDR2-5]
MNRETLRALLPSLVADHLPRNVGNIHYRVYDGHAHISPIGLHIDPQPFQGTVIAKTDEALIIKTGRISFAAVDRHLATEDPEPGTKVQVVPYARRDFSGERIDKPIEETQHMEDGRSYTVSTVVLGRRMIKLPLPEARCPELADLIHQVEELPAPDGFRTIANMLADANARDFSSVDPAPAGIIDTPPAIIFHVSTVKYAGQAAIVYDRGLDLYVVELRRDGDVHRRVDQIDFTSLAATLEDLIDDGSWRRIQVVELGRKAKRTLH